MVLSSDSSSFNGFSTKIVVSYGRKISSLTSSLYLTVILISCSPYFGSPSNSSGMLNGTGASISISSINCVCFFMFESPKGSSVTKPNNAS